MSCTRRCRRQCLAAPTTRRAAVAEWRAAQEQSHLDPAWGVEVVAVVVVAVVAAEEPRTPYR